VRTSRICAVGRARILLKQERLTYDPSRRLRQCNRIATTCSSNKGTAAPLCGFSALPNAVEALVIDFLTEVGIDRRHTRARRLSVEQHVQAAACAKSAAETAGRSCEVVGARLERASRARLRLYAVYINVKFDAFGHVGLMSSAAARGIMRRRPAAGRSHIVPILKPHDAALALPQGA